MPDWLHYVGYIWETFCWYDSHYREGQNVLKDIVCKHSVILNYSTICYIKRNTFYYSSLSFKDRHGGSCGQQSTETMLDQFAWPFYSHVMNTWSSQMVENRSRVHRLDNDTCTWYNVMPNGNDKTWFLLSGHVGIAIISKC